MFTNFALAVGLYRNDIFILRITLIDKKFVYLLNFEQICNT